MMRILFVGAVEFSRQCLEELIGCGQDIAAVLTLEQAAAAGHADFADLGVVAAAHGIPCHRIRDINEPGTVELIRSLRPDLILVLGWSQLIGKAVLEIPPRGCIGSHPALLPQHRGRHPIVWALVEGLTESGLTLFSLNEEVDGGDILWQRSFPIRLEDDAASIYARVCAEGRAAVRELLPQLEQGIAHRVPQDASQATHWRKRTDTDGEIAWETPTLRTYNLIRALTRPYVGAHTFYQGRKLRVWRSALPSRPTVAGGNKARAGTVVGHGDSGLLVKTGDGYLRVLEYDAAETGSLPVGVRLGR